MDMSMDMETPSGTMAAHTMAGTMTMEMPASTSSAMDMGGMGHGGMDMGGNCKISMLWNWNVKDACFISKSWHITSNGMFAGSCIGTICLVIALEFLRRAVKEFDRHIINQHVAKHQTSISPSSSSKAIITPPEGGERSSGAAAACAVIPPFRPSVFQQAIRALLHMVQFAVAYFIMLLAMYYNGYIIICIFIGAYLGSFIFHWEQLPVGGQQTSAAQEATVCCG
ncbi:Copper transport protein ctr4 [Cladobotryum mycophilum]|uniref:Copper transport protein n=1 Tax=Cladobotryum mycophilum TaxID=491253 RepID=A0ABR0SL38_9HYPO